MPGEPRLIAALPVTRVVVAGDGDGENVVKSGLAMDGVRSSQPSMSGIEMSSNSTSGVHVRRISNASRRVPRRPNGRAFVGDEFAEDLERVGVVVRHEDRDSA